MLSYLNTINVLKMSNVINIAEKLSKFNSHWDPHIIGELNNQHVKLAKLKGEFVWHTHDNEDELFLIIRGSLSIEFRDKVLEVKEGEIVIIPKGVEHKPVAKEEVEVLLFEPVTTINTGAIKSDLTKSVLKRL